MCGRYSLSSTRLTLQQRFALSQGFDPGPRYNIAPTQAAAVIRQDGEGQRTLKALRWGLIPAWAKDGSQAARLINARADSLAEKPSFRGPLRQQRCVVPMDGWIEWKRDGKLKRPFFIHAADNRPFGVAGLWEQWLSPSHELVETFTVITVDAAPALAAIHDRMPAVLQPDLWPLWLDPTPRTPTDLLPLLAPCEAHWPAFHEIDPAIGTVSNDRPGLLAPVGGQGSLF
jgi:putative SOS response-associated peptidase YedK